MIAHQTAGLAPNCPLPRGGGPGWGQRFKFQKTYAFAWFGKRSIWALTFITGKMDDKDKADTRLYKILDSLLICVLFPLMLWSIAAVFNH